MNSELEDIFSSDGTNESIEVLDVKEEPPKKKFKIDFDIKKDKVLFIQLLLIGIWAILTIIIYFFGYNLFEPFIEV